MSRRASSRTSVNAAAVTGRLAANPPQEPESRLWFSDREIGPKRNDTALRYTTEDYRRELKRVERKLYWVAFGSILCAVFAALVVACLVLQAGANIF